MAISHAGISGFFIVPSKMAINQEIYLEECLKRRLLPFINKHHRGGKYVFWPDMASSYYANSVQKLAHSNTPFISKSENVANVLKIRPIEGLWSYLKRQVYQDGWQATKLGTVKKKDNEVYSRYRSKGCTKVS